MAGHAPSSVCVMHDLVSLGEVMLRLSPPKHTRLRQTDSLVVRPCGAQFNVAANMAVLGEQSAFLTRLPDNELGRLAKRLGAGYGVDMSHVQFGGTDKIGMVFLEFGAAPRRHLHLYDREGSAAGTITAEAFAWHDILAGAQFAYLDGIFPALSTGCREAALAYIDAAKAAGCRVCFDVNYRETLWDAPSDALALYRRVLPEVDVLVTNRTVSEQLFGYRGEDTDLLHAYRRDFGSEWVCMTYRHMDGMFRGSWWSVALYEERLVEGRRFDYDVVDRFGTGDAFFAGLLYAYLQDGDGPHALDFGSALCAMAHTVEGDVADFVPEEVEAVLAEDYTLVTKR